MLTNQTDYKTFRSPIYNSILVQSKKNILFTYCIKIRQRASVEIGLDQIYIQYEGHNTSAKLNSIPPSLIIRIYHLKNDMAINLI